MNTTIRTIVAAAAVMAVSACGGNTKGASEAQQTMAAEEVVTTVEVAEAIMTDVPQEEVYSSTIQAYTVNNVVPQSGGRITKINVEVGDFVSAGQVLAEMDRVNLEQSRLKLANDSTELARIKNLFEQGGVSQSDFEAMELAYKVSKAQFSNLLENTVLRSPINGVITARNYDKGDMYGMASPIYVVQQITPVKILVGISETDYTKVKKGDSVTLTADALPGREFTGKVNRIHPTIDPATHTVLVEIVVPNGDRALRPGMFSRVKVTFEVNHSIVVPDGAIIKQQGSGVRSVYVVNGDNTVSSAQVTLGRHFGGKYEILDGLNEGDQVVVKGQSALRNGSTVKILQ